MRGCSGGTASEDFHFLPVLALLLDASLKRYQFLALARNGEIEICSILDFDAFEIDFKRLPGVGGTAMN